MNTTEYMLNHSVMCIQSRATITTWRTLSSLGNRESDGHVTHSEEKENLQPSPNNKDTLCPSISQDTA